MNVVPGSDTDASHRPSERRSPVEQVGPLEVNLEQRTVTRDNERVSLGRRAYAILAVLIEHRGSLVTKQDLAKQVWRDRDVEENTLQVHVMSLRRALGTERSLIQTIPGRGYILLARPIHAPGRTRRATHQELPYVDTLFGRETAITHVVDLMASRQVVTLVGAGGIGKTSLAVELCRGLGDRFEVVRFISLSSISTERQAREALLSAFSGTARGTAVSVDQLVGALKGTRCLLVLDNCEHLIDVAAAIAVDLTAANSDIRVVATSREPLAISGEALYWVPTLACPPEGATLEQLETADSVSLFTYRSRRFSMPLVNDEATLSMVADICRRLDGIPLAIELAASRTASLGLEAIKANLNRRFAILTGGSRDALPRHQTLRAVFDWSYRLLSAKEQLVFRLVGVFVDGFSLEGAWSLATGFGLTSQETTEALASLVSKSLISMDRTRAKRYQLLDSARAYAIDCMEANGEKAAADRAHAEFFKSLVADVRIAVREAAGIQTWPEFEADRGNLRSAMTWAFSPLGDVRFGIELASQSASHFFELSALDECTYWSSKALQALRDASLEEQLPTVHLNLLCAYAAALVYIEGPSPLVYTLWEQTLAVALAHDALSHQLRAMWGLWNASQYGGFAYTALNRVKEFDKVASTRGSTFQATLSHRLYGIALHYLGRHHEAAVELKAALSSDELDTKKWVITGIRTGQAAVTKATLARVLWFRGDREGALAMTREAEDDGRTFGHELTLAYILLEASVSIAIFTRDSVALVDAVEELARECKKAALHIWLQCCDAFMWVARAMNSRLDSSELRSFETAIVRLKQTHYLAVYPLVAVEYARALHTAGRSSGAVDFLSDVIGECELSGNLWYIDELRAVLSDLPG
ncbi:transcriptional regulator [Paraburkholderia sp. CNPSo 3155]|nr:transcriptional regulator [Paraburkholderia atlantica]